MSKNNGFGKFLAGLAIGAGIGVLYAPKKGERTRRELTKKLDDVISQAKTMDADDIKDYIYDKVDDIKAELGELDKEKVYAIAKKKGQEIQAKAEDLVQYALDKGTPVLEQTAAAAKEATIKTIKDVLAKLEAEKADE